MTDAPEDDTRTLGRTAADAGAVGVLLTAVLIFVIAWGIHMLSYAGSAGGFAGCWRNCAEAGPRPPREVDSWVTWLLGFGALVLAAAALAWLALEVLKGRGDGTWKAQRGWRFVAVPVFALVNVAAAVAIARAKIEQDLAGWRGTVSAREDWGIDPLEIDPAAHTAAFDAAAVAAGALALALAVVAGWRLNRAS